MEYAPSRPPPGPNSPDQRLSRHETNQRNPGIPGHGVLLRKKGFPSRPLVGARQRQGSIPDTKFSRSHGRRGERRRRDFFWLGAVRKTVPLLKRGSQGN